MKENTKDYLLQREAKKFLKEKQSILFFMAHEAGFLSDLEYTEVCMHSVGDKYMDLKETFACFVLLNFDQEI